MQYNNLIEPTSELTIFLPCYNSRDTLPKTIISIQKQTLQNFYVVMIDNNSNDDSVEVFKQFTNNDNRFECKCYTETLSLGGNFNRCLENLSTNFYTIMHTDDEYHPKYLEEMLVAMKKHPEANIAYCNASIINSDSKKIFSIKSFIKNATTKSFKYKIYSGYSGLVWISEYNKIIAPTVIYHKSVLIFPGEFNSLLKFTLDWEYYFRILKEDGYILHVNQNLFNYRIHNKQQTKKLIISMDKYHEMKMILNEIHNHIEMNFGFKSKFKYRFLIYTSIADIISDILSFKINHIKPKVDFIRQLIITV